MDGTRPQSQSLDEPDERRQLPGIQLDFVRVGDLFASRSITQPGWRWSTNIGPIAGTGSCQVAHRGIVISGHMRIEMDDGEVLDLVPGLVHIVPPGHFIPILEETGLIHQVGRWALRKAIGDYLRWRAAGLPAPFACMMRSSCFMLSSVPSTFVSNVAA